MLNGEKTFTKSGNIRAATKTELCGWVLKAWKNIGVDLVKKSFIACGQVKDAKLEDVSCMKPGRPLEGALPLAQELWQLKSEDIDFKNLCKKTQSTAPMLTKILREYDKLTNSIHENSS